MAKIGVKKGSKFNKYTPEFKEQICKRYLENGESTYSLGKEINSSDTVVMNWIRKYQKGGIEELAKDARGNNGSKKGKNRKKFSSIEEELEYVKAERDILKKISEIQKRQKK